MTASCHKMFLKNAFIMVIVSIFCLNESAFGQANPEIKYTPLIYRDAEWYGSTFWTGPDWTRVGRDWHHPGQNTPSVRRFEAPCDGQVMVTGRVFKLHLSGDGIRAFIRHNNKEVWKTEIEGKDEKGIEPKLTLDMKKGDSLRFIVEKLGNIGCDTTGWDPIVTYSDGKLFCASKSFEDRKQGAGCWFYEMEGTGPIEPPIVTSTKPVEVVAVSPALQSALAKIAQTLAPKTEQALLSMVLEAWWREDKLDDTAKSYECAVTNHLARARVLAEDLRVKLPVELASMEQAKPESLDGWRVRYLEVRLFKREMSLRNPLLKFDELLFCKRAMPSYSHLVMQYFGWRQRGGGGLYVLSKPGYSLETRNIVGSQLPAGSYLEPRLSYDGKKILFAFVECDSKTPSPASLPVNEEGKDERYLHLYEIGVDGKGFRQLTSGTYDDMMGEYLPDGGIVFVSTRRKGYSRCFGGQFSQRWHTYTLHRADADGRNIRILSWNDVSEWFPAVSGDGQILFARWDYIDRDAVTHQNLWSCRPDGSNPMAVWGNGLPSPHCTFQVKPVPGSHKLVFIASAHHAVTAGPVCLLDTSIGLNAPEAVERVTPLIYPEAEGAHGQLPGQYLMEWYESPWPLSENYFLVAYSPYGLRSEGTHIKDPNPDNALGIYLLDRRGNRELIYRDPEIGVTTPIPVVARPMPPILASHLPENPPQNGEMMIYDVYKGLDGVPRGSIAAIRIVQIFPKTTYVANQPRIGLAGEENGRAILGTVPVESDGSARFLLPAGKKVLFQAIDKDGFARRIMRSSTYVQPGEVTSCTGCHEYGAMISRTPGNVPLAMKRPASTIEPGPFGGRPFSFVEVVQPVLDKHCVSCHGGPKSKSKRDLTATPSNGFTRSYWTLCGNKEKNMSDAQYLVPRYFQRNQIQITPADDIRSARRSKLIRMLLDPPGHNNVKLGGDDIRRLATWIDLNAIFYGVYDQEGQALQLVGQPIPMPEIQ
ncbi:MAG: hypothetical protein A2283_14085 [Lentisphaerae bacterium RIFOXYA12_FULL_48_11]|nr:MAG: hypothetical protein A2283_14085 [Lentisphaerae bacterium RIFOXYA12_FULL_48_11]